MSQKTLLFEDAVLSESIAEAELLDYLSGADSYYPVQKFASIKQLLLNFILALSQDQDVTLVDADFSQQELIDLGLMDALGIAKKLKPLEKARSKDWVNSVFKSQSRITLFTSGTTGLPKKVSHTVSTLTRMVRAGEHYARDKWILAYNPTHMAGLQVLFQSLMNRNRIINVFGLATEKAARVIQESEATHLSATPTFYRMLLGTGKSFPHIKRATVGGEKSSGTLHQKMQAAFPHAKINNIYASTELGSLFVSKGENFKVLENLDGLVKVAEDGELFLHSSLLPGGKGSSDWYATGDLVEVLERDPLEFKILSRKTEMINVGGYKVNPNEVEQVLEQFPDLLRCRVFGKANSVLGNMLCAELQMKEGAELDKRAIQLYLNEHLQDFKIPRMMKKVDHIETARTGKITRKS